MLLLHSSTADDQTLPRKSGYAKKIFKGLLPIQAGAGLLCLFTAWVVQLTCAYSKGSLSVLTTFYHRSTTLFLLQRSHSILNPSALPSTSLILPSSPLLHPSKSPNFPSSISSLHSFKLEATITGSTPSIALIKIL